MKFDELENKMRVYETVADYSVLPSIYMVARLDGKGFTKLTKTTFNKPFDELFNDHMRTVVKALILNHGFSFIYGYTQSDEISLLFNVKEDTFNRKLRKLNSVLAGIASTEFTYTAKLKGSFDCRICQLPTIELVQDYFSWRQEDAYRNSINAYIYWSLRNSNYSARKATSLLNGLNKNSKLELLLSKGINFNSIEPWHKRGVEFYFNTYMKEGWNPIIKETTLTLRKELIENDKLTFGQEYRDFIRNLIISYE